MKKTILQFGIAFLLVFVFTFTGGKLFGQECLPSMLGYWKLGELSGPVYEDASGAARNAIAGGAPSQITGISGRAQEFSLSSSTYLTIPDDPVFDWAATQSFSVELWVKYTRTTGSVMVFMARNDYPLSLTQWWIGSESGKITFWFRGSNGPSGYVASLNSYADGNWHQVVAVRDGNLNRMYLYVDGVVQNAGGYPFGSFGNLASTNPITIGNMVTNSVPEFFADAGIDEVAVYSEALSAATVLEQYNNMKNFSIGYCSGDEPVFLTEPVNTATVQQLYTYDVDASGNSKPTYQLITGPVGMEIDEITGVIGWTPLNQSQNGAVTVRASNNKGSVDQNFNIYLADQPMCTPNLIDYWDFDLVGQAGWVDKKNADYVFSGSGPVTVPGIAGNAIMFDGVNDSLNLIDDVEPGNIFFDFKSEWHAANFTIEFWMNSTVSFTGGNPQVILGRDEPENSTQYWIGVFSDGDIGLFMRDWIYPIEDANVSDLRGDANLLDGNWHHVAITYSYNAGDLYVYVDKEVVAEDHGKKFLDLGGGTPLNIGHIQIEGSSDLFWYEGMLDELAFYSAALNQTAINNNYDNTYAGNNHCVYNYAPVFTSRPDSTVLQENLYVYNIAVEDINTGDPITISKVSAPAWLNSFSYTPGSKNAVISGTPGNADVGTHFVTIRVSDGYTNVDQTFSVRVINANDPPVFSFVAATSVAQNDSYTATVLALDPDGDDLTYSAPQVPDWLTFNPDTRVLTGVPDNDAVGENEVTVRVNDGTVDLDTSFIITVTNVNDPPAFTSTAITQVSQNALYSYKAEADDPDGDVLVYSAVQKPSWLNFDPSTQILSGTPGGDDVGVHNVTLRVADAQEEVDQVFQIQVTDVNDPPQFSTTPPLTVDQNSTYTYTVLAVDPEGDPVTYSAPQIPSWLTFNPSTRILSGIPGNTDVGLHPVTLRASDGTAENDQSFSLTVNNVNDLPVFTSIPIDYARVGKTYLYSITVSDPDPNDVLTFTAESVPAWLTLTPASTTAILSGTPASGDLGTHAIIIKVSDGIGNAVQGFSITVTPDTWVGDVDQLVNRVYPNPADGEVYFELAEYGDAWLKIMDTKGAVLMEVRAENTDKFSVDLSELSSDIYFYSITINEKTNFGKLVRE